MSLTRRLRPLLAGTRQTSVSVGTVMVLVLAVVSVYVLCSVHLGEHQSGTLHAHGSTLPSDDGGVLAVDPASSIQESAAEPVAEPLGAEPLGADPHGCTDHGVVAAQSDPLLPATPVLAVVPERLVLRLAPAVVHQDHRAASGLVAAHPPSLHALGISRT